MPRTAPRPRSAPVVSIAVLLAVLTGPVCAQVPVPSSAVPTAPPTGDLAQALRGRVAPPHEETLAAYIGAGAEYARPHVLTDREWSLVAGAIADLPPLHQRVLEQRLARLSFVEAPSSTGTALTRSFDGPDGRQMFDITIRADVLETSLTDFLTGKEAMLFADDGSGYSVHISAGERPALPYLLLHEASHVVDRSLGLTADGAFRPLWSDDRSLAEPFASGLLSRTTYRRGPRLPLAQAADLYAALADSPFVSLYSTASAGEDFAELAAWRELLRRSDAPLTIEVRDGDGRSVTTVHPLRSGAVQARFGQLDELLARAGAVSAPL